MRRSDEGEHDPMPAAQFAGALGRHPPRPPGHDPHAAPRERGERTPRVRRPLPGHDGHASAVRETDLDRAGGILHFIQHRSSQSGRRDRPRRVHHPDV